MPASPEDLIAFLDSLDIPSDTLAHPALHTVADSRSLRGEMPGGHAKNLLVKDKKGRLFVLVLEQLATVDLKNVHTLIGAQGRVSFVKADQMMDVWGVTPGSVTPFGAINDAEKRVTVVLDSGLMAHGRVNFHPLVNTRTTGLSSAHLIKFLRATGHEPVILALAQPAPGPPTA